MKLESIITFITVIEENSFVGAAKKLGVSKAAVSRQVSNLEADLGAQLLQRTTRQISLTEIGLQYFQQCKKILSELQETEDAITSSNHEATGKLNITSSRYFAEEYLIPRLPEFMAQNPKLRIRFELAERFPDLAQEKIDILFGVSLEGPAELVRRRVATTRYVLCASPKYFKKFGTPKTPAELSKHRYITHSMRKSDHMLTFEDNKEVYVEPILWLNDSRAMLECAIKGMGIVKLHDYMVAAALKNKQLVEIFSKNSEQQSVYLYYQQSKYLQPKIRRFIDFYVSH